VGAQISNTLTGQTSGTIITVDYTTDFQQLSTDIQSLVNAVTTLNNTLATSMTTANTSFNAAFSPGTNLVPNTIGHTLDALALSQYDAAGAMQQAADNLTTINASLTAQHDDLTGNISANLATLNAAASVMIAQNSEKIAFEQTATQAALKRSNLPEVEVPQPDIESTIKKAVSNASVVSAQTKATGFISESISDALSFGTDVAKAQLLKIDFIGDAVTKAQNFAATATGKNPTATDAGQTTNSTAAQLKLAANGNAVVVHT
jgi:hypothetical protein